MGVRTNAGSDAHRRFMDQRLESGRAVGYNLGMTVVESNPAILSGTPVFHGTRVPVQALIDHIEGGDTLDTFLTDFPTVRREQVIEFLQTAKSRLSVVVS